MKRLGHLLSSTAFAVLCVATVFAPVALGSLYPWSLFGLRMLVAAALVLLGASLCLGTRLRAPPKPLTIALIAYLALVSASAVRSPDPFPTQQELLNIFVYASGFFLASSLIISARRLWLFIGSVLVGAAIMGTYGIAQWLGYGFTPVASGDTYVSSFFYNHSHYAGFLDLTAPLALGIALGACSWAGRIAAALLALLLYANMGLAFSDAGWVALGLATIGLLGMWIASAPRQRSRWMVGLGLTGAGVVALAGFLVLYPGIEGGLNERIQTIVGESAANTGLSGRMAVFEMSLELIEDNPLLGVGPGNYVYRIVEHRPISIEGEGTLHHTHQFVNYAHNDYLQVASESGIFALIAFVSFWIIGLTRKSPAPTSITLGARAGIIALLIHGFVDGNLTINSSVAFLAFATVGALHCKLLVPSGNEGQA